MTRKSAIEIFAVFVITMLIMAQILYFVFINSKHMICSEHRCSKDCTCRVCWCIDVKCHNPKCNCENK